MEYKEFLELVLSLPEIASSQGEKIASNLFDGALRQLTKKRAGLNVEDDKREMMEFRRLLLPPIKESGFCGYIYEKPRGYAGDFITQEMIWMGRTVAGDHRYLGSTPVGKILTAFTFDMANCLANEERILRLEKRVRCGGNRIASIGCGSCIELWRQKQMESYDVLLLDKDTVALAQAKEKISPSIINVRFIEQNILKFSLQPGREVRLGDRDLVYAFGLFDYFDCVGASRIANGL